MPHARSCPHLLTSVACPACLIPASRNRHDLFSSGPCALKSDLSHVGDRDRAFIVYGAHTESGKTIRNSEVHTVRSGKLTVRHAHSSSWVPAAIPIRTGDDLHEVTVGIFEVDASASIVMVDLSFFRLCGIGPISQPSFAYPPEYLVELCFTHQERVVLWGDLFLSIHKIDICIIVSPNDLKTSPLDGPRQTQYPSEKSCGCALSREETIV